jgi:hypothetical protein
MKFYRTSNISLAAYLMSLWTNDDKEIKLDHIERGPLNTFVFADPHERCALSAEHFKRNGRIRVLDFVHARQLLAKKLRELPPPADPSKPLTPEFWKA